MPATIAIINADILPMIGEGKFQALAIEGNAISALGSNAEIQALCDDTTQVIDADGNTVMPGFVESHMHLFLGAYSSKVLHLPGVEGTESVTKAICEFAAANPDESLLVAQGLGYEAFDGKRDADRHILDQICPDRPLLIQSSDFHNGWANTIALTEAGVLHGRDVGSGSQIELDDDGVATGVLTEPPAVSTVQSLGAHGGREVLGLEGVEPAGTVTRDQREADKSLLRAGLNHCAEHGITTIINMDGNVYQADLLREIEAEGDLNCRLELPYHFTPGEPDENLEIAEQMRRDLNSDMLWCNRVKFFMDGVMDMGTGFRVQDYPDQPGHKSEPLHAPERFAEVATELDKRGFQIAVHAIGDGAVRTVLDGYEAAHKANGPQGNRHRVEHIELHDPADRPRFAELDVVASFMPPHPPGCGDFPVEPLASIIGKDQWPDAYAWRTLKDAGVRVCFSSDWPIAALPPLTGIDIAMTRETWAADQKDERLTFQETLEAYTIEGAYACHREDKIGSLEPGLLADIVILDRILTEGTAAKASVTTTICNGAVTYQK
ncbi:amidohydrolase [Rhodobacteraceae bacterium B1Z28]|uniref:Amidohydrolase n=1 Tax=Ruegeria haliotis TaxID=2747601 RepID=A0ABX2PJR8_9RHOB|nr:amidohydrolase [Ruegeria haliotis]NVO54339.1 amidohydrolase [Ruegeria haliotis]